MSIVNRCEEFRCLRCLQDILLVRMTSDSVRPPEERYNYRNAVSGLITLVKDEGVHGLLRGMGTNLVRCGITAL